MPENNDHRAFRPMFPWVLVKVLQREQQVGRIIMVEGPKQNKPMHEGIVLVTFEPTQRWIQGQLRTVSSNLQPGQHVLFQHWAGLPVVGFDDKVFRIVKELEWSYDREGGIVGLVEDSGPPEGTLVEMLEKLLKPVPIDELVDEQRSADEIAEELLRRFVIVDRDKPSVTLSGL